jgi:hypothetical protein
LSSEFSRNGLLRPCKSAEQCGLASAIASEEEMGAAGEFNRLPETGEGTAVANFKTAVEMDGWGWSDHRLTFRFIVVLSKSA